MKEIKELTELKTKIDEATTQLGTSATEAIVELGEQSTLVKIIGIVAVVLLVWIVFHYVVGYLGNMALLDALTKCGCDEVTRNALIYELQGIPM